MTRPLSRYVRVVLVCVLVVTSGCATLFDQTTDATDTPATTETATTGATTVFFEVDIRTEDPVTIRVRELASQEVVLEETYKSKGVVDVGRSLEPATDYRIVVRTNGTVRWNESVRAYEGYELRVEANGTVTVVEFFES